MYDEEGEQVWERSLDLNGKVINGSNAPCPFLYQGQYYDKEIELAYNRFRYYDPDDGRYISKDPIGLESREANFYSYVGDSNTWIDVFGLSNSYKVQRVFPDWLEKGIHIDIFVNSKGKLLKTPSGKKNNVEVQVEVVNGNLQASLFKQKGKTSEQNNKAVSHIQKLLNKNDKTLLKDMSIKGKKALKLDTGEHPDGVKRLKNTVDHIDNILN
ncbi:RHS repeat domain-containing protein [Tenacibaculum maritimum]|nr:RHS repeat-associated core domain-containing protein [Tenacibaculum maritimum]